MKRFNLPKIHWRHYFGGFSFIILVLQLASGIFLIFYYDPSLSNAYKSVQYLTNKVTGGSLMRNLHRWIAFTIFLSIFLHVIRSTLRKDFLIKGKRVLWLTGCLLIIPLFMFVVTGIILPWEWKGYWFMEMVPNYAEFLPFAGPYLKPILIDIFTLPRTFVIHILILPLLSFILIDYHFYTTLRKRGICRYILRHFLISLLFIIILFVLATYVTIPSEDPDIVPFPLEGEYIPAPEWYFLIILLPLLHFKGNLIPILSIYTPLLLFVAFTLLPYYWRGRVGTEVTEAEGEVTPAAATELTDRGIVKGRGMRKFLTGLAVFLIFAVFVSLMYRGVYHSPTLGCNGCHNLASGRRMGVPPEAFKDRHVLPNLNNNQWMMGHWFYPTVVW